ncbi:MAG: hypothetical protein DWH82_11745 [Planctomycetota bacterium]|nr:MAG: hypothetical protein DWH82_11745 [Planctomycetota bacterium]
MIQVLSGRFRLNNKFFDRFVVPLLEETDEMINTRLEVKEGLILLKGDYQAGFMRIPIQVEFRPSASNGMLVVDLGAVRLATGFNAPAMVRQLLVDQMEVRVQEIPGARMDGERIEMDLPTFAQGHGIELSGRLEALEVRQGIIECVLGPA